MDNTHNPNTAELTYFTQFIGQQNNNPTSSYQAPTNTNELIARLDYHGITQLALQQQQLDQHTRQQLSQRTGMLAANELLKQRALTELFDAFHQAGLSDIVIFKGTALAYSQYTKPWLRPRSDTDCLIDQQQKPDFERVLLEVGYRKKFAIEGNYVSYQSTYSKQLSQRSELNIDLHWRVSNRQILAKAYHINQLTEQADTLKDTLSPNIRIPCPVDSILLAAIHRIGHHAHEERLAWLYDIHLLTQTLDESHWQQLCEKAAKKKIVAITLETLLLCHTVLQTNIPDVAQQQLTKLSQKTELSHFFLNRKLPEWRYFIHDLKGLDSHQQQLQFVIETLFPNPSYLKQQMHTDSLIKAYYQRSWRGLKRVFTRSR